MAEDVKSGEDDVAETDITEDNVGEEAIAEYEVVKDSEDEMSMRRKLLLRMKQLMLML